MKSDQLRAALAQCLSALESLHGLDTETECVTIDVAGEIAAARAALGSQQQQPVAWSRADFIEDDDGRKIGIDEPELYWGKEPPDGEYGWSPLYAHPLQQAEPVAWALSLKEAHDESLDGNHAACRSVLREVIAEMESAAPQPRQQQGWISVSERLPEPGKWVLAAFRHGGKGQPRVIRAMHGPKHTLSEDLYGEFAPSPDYDEKTDQTYWPEGWYERNEFEETNWRVHEDVTHWMPLPPAPEGIGAGAAEGEA